MASLFVIRGNDQGSRFEFADHVRIGRDSASDVQLHDTEVSRQHAEILMADDAFVLVDAGSSNGSFVNGARIERRTLSSGDQIQLGRTLLLFTGPLDDEAEDLADAVDIASEPRADASRIVHSLSQEDGSRAFDLDADLPRNSWLARARSNLQVMYRTALAVSHTLDIDQLLQRIMDLIFEWVEADRGCIMLINGETGRLEPKARRTRQKARRTKAGREDRISISKTILDYVLQHGEGVLTSDARQDDRWDAGASILQAGVREAICVPMQGRYDVVGVIYIDTSTPPDEVIRTGGANKFKEDHLKLMIAIAHQAALAVEDTRYYSAMVQAERLAAIGQTVTILSHHIKNILQGIRGGSYLIDLGLTEEDPEVIRRGWNIVERNQNKISALVLDMLTFSKERQPERVASDLNRVVGEVAELAESRAAELGVRFSWRPAPSVEPFVFDPEMIHRAVLNVVSNALDAAAELAADVEEPERANTNRPPAVEMAAEWDAKAEMLRVVVHDNGPGIPADVMKNLFSPFVSSKGARGTGLGLPVSQKILAEHGGRIQVESTPDEGSTFTLQWPAVAPEIGPGTQVD
ncbi:MAG: FHA domain-containing protein [Pirellulales bacterium]|nr:FHA domain-containing protein [Pirellulales bacterium]